MMTPLRGLAACVILSSAGLAQQSVRPLALVTSTKGAQIRPAGFDYPRSLAAGDLLFAGDTVLTALGQLTVVHCPKSALLSFRSGGDYLLSDREIRIGKGAVTQVREVTACELPPLDPASTRSIYKAARDVRVSVSIDENLQDLAADAARFATFLESVKKIGAQRRGMALLDPMEASPSGATGEPPPGPTYALIVGISRYAKLPQQNWLRFADADAQTFGEFLIQPRGGGLPPDRLKVLTNEEANKAAVSGYTRQFLEEARKNRGTVLLVFAAHGVAQQKKASIVTHESNPEDLYTSGFPMSELRAILSGGLAGVGRLLIFLDVCHAARLGTIESRDISESFQGAIPSELGTAKVFSFLSSRAAEPSWEGPNWGGHGAFTYFVLRGLNGDADDDKDGFVTAEELIEYVRAMVLKSTLRKQHPEAQTMTLPNETRLSNTKDPSTFTPPADWTPLTPDQISRRQGQKNLGASDAATRSLQLEQPQPRLEEFRAAIRAGRILPGAKEARSISCRIGCARC